MPEQKQWIITLEPDQPIQAAAAALAAEGLEVGEVLAEVGCVTGRADEATAERLRRLSGVADVAPDFPVELGPPGRDETW